MNIVNLNGTLTVTSLELVDFINRERVAADGDAAVTLRHDHFMAKVPSVLGADQAPKFLGTSNYLNGAGVFALPPGARCLVCAGAAGDHAAG